MSGRGEDEAGGGVRFEAEERELRELVRGAGPREELPADDLAGIERAARALWRERYARRASGWRWPGAGLAAAALLAVAAGAGLWLGRGGPAPRVATVERLAGVARIVDAAAGGPPLAVGSGLAAGLRLETAADPAGGRLALRLAGGASLRLDADSRLRLPAPGRVELERGAVYLDSGPAGAEAVEVATPFGRFTELGTQFEVRLLEGGGAARLRVREGRVAVDAVGGRALGVAGEQLEVGAGGVAARAPVARAGAEWGWVVAAAPPFEIEGAAVRAFLDWYARETGLELELGDAGAAAIAVGTRLRGSVAHLEPGPALEVVLGSAGLVAERHDGRLVVRVAPGGG